ncbi:cupin domain-containing protein [Kribbella sp. NPDC023972]|uniref:cupin domain-containing protein n=1 Tax=Kribbella sp. NPDC023972 TaxID=3154795 RepID=UPI00340D3559
MGSESRFARAPASGVVAAGDGRALQAGPTRPTVKAGPHAGGRLIGMLESEVPPGGGFPGHVHDEYEEVFYVLTGDIDYLIDDSWVTAPAGSTVLIPPGRVHGFRNSGSESARHLAIASPADAMTMIEELTQSPPDQWDVILGRYRSRLV